MNLTFEGWYNENQEEMRKDVILKNGHVTITKRLDTFITDFGTVFGIDEKGIPYHYDAVRIFVYLNDNGTNIETKEFVPWFDGNEVYNVELPHWLLKLVKQEIDTNPAPTLN